ncbi:MAG: CHRD domain-containing protein [Cyclobacteriaceae bacterium]
MENDLDPNVSPELEESMLRKNEDAATHQQMDVSNFRAHLSGDEEVPPADTKATGEAIFRLNKKDGTLYYKLIVANIENVRMAHIHMAEAGSNGGVVAWLYPDSAPPVLIPGQFQGILAEGVITADNLTGALADASLDDLLAAMTDGKTYVNVHTNQFPGGEIRGQIK